MDADVDGVGDAGRAMLSGMGLGGIGEGSCQRWEGLISDIFEYFGTGLP